MGTYQSAETLKKSLTRHSSGHGYRLPLNSVLAVL